MGKIKRIVRKNIKGVVQTIGKKNEGFRSFYEGIILKRRQLRYGRQYLLNAVDDHTIIFSSFMGRKYACSPKAIYEEMQRQNLDFHYVWVIRKGAALMQEELEAKGFKNTTVVRFGSRDFYKYYAKAKFWVSNSRIEEAIPKRPKQVYIQTWHGTPLKRLGYDIPDTHDVNALHTLKKMRHLYSADAAKYDYLISPSAFTTEKYISAFKLEDRKDIIKEVGYPRNDFLYTFTSEDVARIKADLGIPDDKKVILYAPTWRDNQHEVGVGYTYELGFDFDYLREALADEYVILFRTHYFVANEFDFEKYEGFIINATQYSEINDLYIVSDLLITDYSSVFFDFASLRRPMLFYMYDLDEYTNTIRDFYFDIKELPGPISKTQEELVKDIQELDRYDERYHEAYQAFHDKFNYLDDGHAAARVIETCILSELD